jgi:hypothetical protein
VGRRDRERDRRSPRGSTRGACTTRWDSVSDA